MKGVIAIALKEMVISRFGDDKWKEILNRADIKKEPLMLPITDLDDEVVMRIIQSACEVLGMTKSQVGDAFGNHWVCNYALKHYSSYYDRSKSARDFLLNMDNVHVAMTKNIQNARPPRFKYEWENDKVLNIKYLSSRGLIDILVGLVKGVATYFNEDILVNKTANDTIKVTFR